MLGEAGTGFSYRDGSVTVPESVGRRASVPVVLGVEVRQDGVEFLVESLDLPNQFRLSGGFRNGFEGVDPITQLVVRFPKLGSGREIAVHRTQVPKGDAGSRRSHGGTSHA